MSASETPLVSILLPVYNGERYLSAAIESVLSQSYPSWELITIDDCSTDSSRRIIESYAGRDSRIRPVYNQANSGLFENYNRCLELSSGELIKPFAQDDILYPEALAKMSAAFQEHPSVTLVSCAKRWIDGTGALIKEVYFSTENRFIPGKEVILYNLIGLTNWVGEPSTVMFRKSSAGTGFDVNFYHYGDIEYWFRIVEHGQYLFLSEILCDFRRHDENCTNQNLRGLYFGLDIFRLGRKYRQVLADFGESEERFFKRAVETIALNLDHLVHNSGLSATATTGIIADRQSKSNDSKGTVASGYAELSFHSLRYITELIAELDHLKRTRADEHENWSREVNKLLNSPSWRITEPLRTLKQLFKSVRN